MYNSFFYTGLIYTVWEKLKFIHIRRSAEFFSIQLDFYSKMLVKCLVWLVAASMLSCVYSLLTKPF